ncbi:MAG: hypothetical protein AAF206_17110 [Bacteroidota bacterium]
MPQLSIRFFVFLFLMGVNLGGFAQRNWGEDAFPPGEDGLREMLMYVLEADEEERRELTEALVPDLSDCEAVFDGKYGKKIFKYQTRLSKIADIVLQPLLEEQTQILIWGSNTEELLAYQGEARDFQGGYRELAPYIKAEQTFFRAKFVEPGHKLGSSYDLFVHVNGHWTLIHRPWAVLFQ